MIPVVGWGQARFGGKRLWMAALTLFVAGSALCATAWNAESLIAFRVLQGVGAGMIFPLMQTLAMQTARAAQGGSSSSGRVVATVSLPIAAGPILGPVLGGVILNWLDWRWLFLVNVPVCAVGLYLAWRFLRPTAGRARHPLPAGPARPAADRARPGRDPVRTVERGQERRSRPRRRAGPADRRAGAADRLRGLDLAPGRARP